MSNIWVNGYFVRQPDGDTDNRPSTLPTWTIKLVTNNFSELFKRWRSRNAPPPLVMQHAHTATRLLPAWPTSQRSMAQRPNSWAPSCCKWHNAMYAKYSTTTSK